MTVDHVSQLIKQLGLAKFYRLLMEDMDSTFRRWPDFEKKSRLAIHAPTGVLELMPCSDDHRFAVKYVNGHPANPQSNKLSVVAIGLLADVVTGYPLLITEMTLLTAIRTAITAVLAAKYLARKDSHHIAIIGTGAQSEFQIMAMATQFHIHTVRYFDCDQSAMEKFANNLNDQPFALVACEDIRSAVAGCDILITATADKKKNCLISADLLSPGMHVHAMGGDCPDKTEFFPDVLKVCKVYVEYLPQSLNEGEIQNLSPNDADKLVVAELWEVITGLKPARENVTDITFFDSVGFALEDLSVLNSLYALIEEYGLGEEVGLIPELSNPKDLYSLIR